MRAVDAAATAQLRLFGLPTLTLGGQATALPFERRSQLLAWLALRGDWAPRAEAAALLWPGIEDRLALANLRKTLFRLAASPWQACLLAEAGALRFAGSTDTADFDAALQERRLDDALALRAGELLTGFDDPGNEAWTSWLGYERERRRAAWRGAALERLAQGLPGPAALDLSARLLDSDPLDDAALQQQVRALLATAQAGAAREAIDRFTQRLDSELGVAPDATLRALRASLDAGVAVVAPAPAAAPAFAEDGFIGRGPELRQIASLLEQDDCRVLCLLGPGGIGKTRLARRALRELAPGFSDGGAFVALEGVNDALGFGHALARALELPDGADPVNAAVAALGARRLLLVLDNAEDFAPQAAVLQTLLEACPRIKLLLTSRERPQGLASWSLVLEGLPCPDAEDVDRVEAFDAARLFVRHARRVEPGWNLAANAAALVEICRLVDGQPLALELAAAWVRVMPCSDIAAELRSGSELLRAADPERPGRHASLEQVFEQSWQRLAPAEQAALARLTVFRGGFEPASARAVADASLPVLAALVDRSLLHKDGQPGGSRLRLHPLVQQLASLRLPEPQRERTRARHAAHFVEQLMRDRPALEGGNREVLARHDAEIDNARAAWRWAASQGPAALRDDAEGRAHAQTLAAAAWALLAHVELRGRRHEGLRNAQWAADSAAARRHPQLRGVLLSGLALMFLRVGRYAECMEQAERAISAAAGTAGRSARRHALSTMAACELALNQPDRARRHYAQALRLATDAAELNAAAVLRDNLALLEKRQGRYAQALALSLEALETHRRLERPSHEARCLNNLGDLYLQTGRHEDAERVLQQSLVLCERIGLRNLTGLVLVNLSYAAQARGDIAAATVLARRALPVLEQADDHLHAAATRHQLANIELARGEHRAAAEELAGAMQGAVAVRHTLLQLYALVTLAQLFAAVGAPRAAAVLRRFVADHPAANPPLREELGPHAADSGSVAWPATLDLGTLAQRVAEGGGEGHAGLREQLQRL